MAFAIAAAVLHAIFGAMQKGKYDPFIIRGAMDISYCAMALPLALIFTPIPDARGWLVLGGAWCIHTIYKYLQAAAYQRGAYGASDAPSPLLVTEFLRIPPFQFSMGSEIAG